MGIVKHRGAVMLAIFGILACVAQISCFETHFGMNSYSDDLERHQNVLPGPSSERFQISTGKSLEVPLRRRLLQYYGRYHFLELSIGSPGQSLELLLDTGSSDTWVYGNNYCNESTDSHYQCYVPEKSSTSEVIPAPPYFEPRYPHSRFQGLYARDAFAIGSGRVKQAEFGMLHEGNGPTGGGLMALGFDIAEFGPNKTFGYVYPNILDTLYNESVIDSRSFGLFLNNGSVNESKGRGSLVLGGYDKSKFVEPLLRFAITSPSDVRRVSVSLVSIDATILGVRGPIWTAASDKTINDAFVPAALDSGDMMAAIPVQAHATLVDQLNRYSAGMLKKPKSGQAFDAQMECHHSSANVSVDFTFQGLAEPLTINVPFSELVLPSTWDDGCVFALRPKPKSSNAPFWLNLGSSILGSMYLVVDYDANAIQLAKARYDGQQVDFVPINHRSDYSF